jgi:hypothetical protein
MSQLIYVLCALTSLACAWLLLSRYRQSGHRLLFWSGLCFGAMTINNIILVIDKLVFPEANLSLLRQSVALVAVLLLLYGLIYEKE